MKTGHLFAAMVLALAGNIISARGDAAHDDPIGFDAIAQPLDLTDPNFLPPSLEVPEVPQLTPQEKTAIQQVQQKAEENKNWLLRDYEQQLEGRQTSTGENAGAQNTNLMAVLGADKDMARAAGINPIDLNAPPELNPLTGEDGKKPNVDLRPDPTLDPLASAGSKTAPLFAPLIIPLDSPASAPVRTPTALPPPTTSSIFSPLSLDLAPAETAEDDAAENIVPSDPGAMDFPGMTAAESNPATKEALDLPNDEVPDALPSEEKAHHDLALELPEATNTDRLQKFQSSALAIPGQPLIKKTTPLVINPLLVKPVDPETPMHRSSPLRRQLDDPYDILQ
jgi:hypothetical protein